MKHLRLFACLLSLPWFTQAAASKPNMIVIMADDLGYGDVSCYGAKAVEKPVHVRAFHATILHLMGLDHERLTYRHAGLDFRLTGVEHAQVVKGVLA